MVLYSKKAQSMAEYAILVALVVSIVVGMQVYVRRGMQGRLRDASDSVIAAINQGGGFSYANQYEPPYRDIDKSITQQNITRHNLYEAGREVKDYIQDRVNVNQTEIITERQNGNQ